MSVRAASCDFDGALHDLVTAGGALEILPRVHLGRPDGEAVHILAQPGFDAGLRADLVARALEGLTGGAPLAWLTRSGQYAVTDTDLAWLAACRQGFARHGLVCPGLVVLTPDGRGFLG